MEIQIITELKTFILKKLIKIKIVRYGQLEIVQHSIFKLLFIDIYLLIVLSERESKKFS